MSNKLISILGDLTPEELEVIKSLSTKLLDSKRGDIKPEPQPTKVKGQRKQKRKSEKSPNKDLDIPEEQPRVNQNRSGTSRRIQQGGPKKVIRSNDTRRGQGKGKVLAVAQAVDTSGNRPNKFENSPDFHSCKSDSKIDKLLNKGRQPSIRRDTIEFIEAECTGCSDVYEVLPSQVYRDDDGLQFVCDRCQKRRRN